MDLKALREMDLELARQICLDELSDILTDYTDCSVSLAPPPVSSKIWGWILF